MEPSGVAMWTDVVRVCFGGRPNIDEPSYRDLRADRWELFQRPRVVPVHSRGVLVDRAVVPWILAPNLLQHRLDGWQSVSQACTAEVSDADTWVIVQTGLPSESDVDAQNVATPL